MNTPPPDPFTEAVACAWLGGVAGAVLGGFAVLLFVAPANPHGSLRTPAAFPCVAVAAAILPTLFSVPAGCAVGAWAKRTGASLREARREGFKASVVAGLAMTAAVTLLPPGSLLLFRDGKS